MLHLTPDQAASGRERGQTMRPRFTISESPSRKSYVQFGYGWFRFYEDINTYGKSRNYLRIELHGSKLEDFITWAREQSQTSGKEQP